MLATSFSRCEVVTKAGHLCNLEKLFPVDCESHAIFCHMDKMLSGVVKVMLLLSDGRNVARYFKEKVDFLSHMGKAFPSPSSPHARNVPIVLHNNVIWLERCPCVKTELLF